MTAVPASRTFASERGAVWAPSSETIERSQLHQFMTAHGFASIESLHERSVEDPEWYWRAVTEFLGMQFHRSFDAVRDVSDGIEFPRWFVNGLMNVSFNCVDVFAQGAAAERQAIVWENEAGAVRALTYGDMYRQVLSFARYLRSIGIGPGDRVGFFLPMLPETTVAFLACARVGAVSVPAFSGYGPGPLSDRLSACGARVLITSDGFVRRSRTVEMHRTVAAAMAQMPSVEKIIVIDNCGIDFERTGRHVSWDDALLAGDASGSPGDCEWVDPNHPLLIVYTSGTTGKPKGIVHSHGGFAAKVGHDLAFCMDVQEDDVLLWLADFGWVVGPLVAVGATMLHATAVYFEGVPDHPTPRRLWELVAAHHVTTLGVAPTLARGLMRMGDEWLSSTDLSSLRAFISSGEPWDPAAWTWLFEAVGGSRLPIINFSGGTEVGGGIVSNYTTLPMKPCGFAGPVLGVAADVVDEDARPVRGTEGELVVRNQWPGMSHSFWEDRPRYLETYWSRFPGLWQQGDLAHIDHDGHWFITGRSDDTIKLAGKRVGPAEIEAALMAHPAVREAAAVGVPNDLKGQSLVCFVVPDQPVTHVSDLADDIRGFIAGQLGRSLVPDTVIFVRALPKTRTQKIVRRVIRARYLGLPPGDLSSLEDTGILQEIPIKEASAK